MIVARCHKSCVVRIIDEKYSLKLFKNLLKSLCGSIYTCVHMCGYAGKISDPPLSINLLPISNLAIWCFISYLNFWIRIRYSCLSTRIPGALNCQTKELQLILFPFTEMHSTEGLLGFSAFTSQFKEDGKNLFNIYCVASNVLSI